MIYEWCGGDTTDYQQLMSDNQVTKLPDGSAFFTATVMSKDEAMALPLKERPLCYRISSELYHAVFEAIGSASMCWKPRPGKEVFASEEASKVAVDLCFKIANEIDTLQSKLTEMEQVLSWASEQRVTLYPAHMEWFFGSTKHHSPTLYAALKSAWEARDRET